MASQFISLYNESIVEASSITTDSLTISDTLNVDTINEYTNDNGVVVDGVKLKDGLINDTAYTEGILLSNSNGQITSSYYIPNRIDVGGSIEILDPYGHIEAYSGLLQYLYSNYIRPHAGTFFINLYSNNSLSPVVISTLDTITTITTPNLYISSCGTGVIHSNSSGRLTSSLIVNGDVDNSAGITYSKLSLNNSILLSDFISTLSIPNNMLATITTAGKVSNSATTATSSNTINTIVSRNSSGAFEASYIYADLIGNVSGNASTSTDASKITVSSTMVGSDYYLTFVPSYNSYQNLLCKTTLIYNTTTNTITANLNGNSTTATTATTATNSTNSTNVNITNDLSSASTQYITFTSSTSGNSGIKVDSTGLTYQPSTNTLTCTTFQGNATSATSATVSTIATDATNANNVLLVSGTATTNYLTFSETSTGNQSIKTDNDLTYNASTNTLTCANFNGNCTTSTSATSATSATTQANGTNNTTIATTAFVQNSIPIGSLQMYIATTAPNSNWLICDGSAISRTTYSALFTLISTTYGVGDGSTTFNIPDMRERMPLGYKVSTNALGTTGGSSTTTLSTTNLPSHSHALSSANAPITVNNGATKWGSTGFGSANFQNTSTNAIRLETISATISGNTNTTGSGTAFSTVSPYLSVNYIIKVL